MTKFKLTKLEKNWILYDVGNSAFTLIVSTIIPIYFNYLAGLEGVSDSDYLAYWGYSASIATLIVAFIGPTFGSIADNKGYKKPIFIVALVIGVVSCIALGHVSHWLVFLVVFIIAKVGYSSSLVFYDAMLTDVTTEDRMDNVSSQGFAWGYIGSCIPFIVCLFLVQFGEGFGISMTMGMTLSFWIIALWWFLVTLPLLKSYKQVYYVEPTKNAVSASLGRLWTTLKQMKDNKKVFIFLLSFFFYIDGVYTIIDMATAYGASLGLDTTQLLLALLLTQFVAFPFAIIFGRLAKKYSVEKLIMVCIAAYTGIALFAVFLSQEIHFWILAVAVGMFQGGIQALSRSYFAKIIPPEKSGEFFGLFDICGKGAAFIGTSMIAIVTQVTGQQNIAVGMLTILFAIGFVLFRKQAKM